MVDGYYDQLPEMFDPAAHEGTQDLVPVPAGWYLAHIVEAEVRDAANGNGNYLWTAFEIIEGQYKGRKVFHNVTIHNASQQAVEIGQRLMTDIYIACGITGPTRSIDVLLHKPIKIRVNIRRDPNGEYSDKNRVTAARPYDFEPKRRGPGAAPVANPGPKPANAPEAMATASATPKGDRPWNQKQT
jgi:hypothetical protein